MAKNGPHEVPPLVLGLLKSVHEKTQDKQRPHYVAIDKLELEGNLQRRGAAILLAALSGWIVTGSRSARAVAITDEGIEVLTRHGNTCSRRA